MAGLDAIRAELERRLVAELGPKDYDAYLEMEQAGKFALPEEKKKPPR